MGEKISVSWDELNSSKVDDKIKQLEMLERTGAHQRHVAESGGYQDEPDSWNFFYIAWVYLAFFGLIFGFCGWAIGEVLFSYEIADEKTFEEFCNYYIDGTEISENNRYYQMEQDGYNIDYIEYKNSTYGAMCTLCWSVIVCSFVGFGLSVAENVVNQNWEQVIRTGGIGLFIGSAGGFVGLFLAGLVYSILTGDGEDFYLPSQMFARAVGWGIYGLFVAIAPGIVIRSWKKSILGLLGGMIGGILGGLLFDPISLIGGIENVDNYVLLSRLVGITAFSCLSGIALGLLEDVAKQGWLKVTGGIIAGKQFILYKGSTYIGSSPKCEIYLFKDPKIKPQHASIKEQRGNYTISPLGLDCPVLLNNRRIEGAQKLSNGDRITIGDTRFTFGLKEKS